MSDRLKTHMGQYNMVGTTVKDPTELPKDLGADEQYSRISGEKVLMVTTVGNHCFLGASVSQGQASKNEQTRMHNSNEKHTRCNRTISRTRSLRMGGTPR